MRSIPVYSQRGGPCAAVIGHGRHLMIYSCEGDFFHILFSHHRASDTHTHTHRGLAPSSPRLPCCRQAQVILKQRRDTRKRKKVKPSSSLSPSVCLALVCPLAIPSQHETDVFRMIIDLRREEKRWVLPVINLWSLIFPCTSSSGRALSENRGLETRRGLKHEL